MMTEIEKLDPDTAIDNCVRYFSRMASEKS